MAFRPHAIAVLISQDPKAAEEHIFRAFIASGACRRLAASRLGCARMTFFSWTKKLGMESTLLEIEKIARREGWHYASGGTKWKDEQESSEKS